MPMNRIQFQRGMLVPQFFARYGTEEQCAAELTSLRWPNGFRCPRCACADHYYIVVGARKPRELPQFTWVNTILGNLKTMINGGHKAFRFGKYAAHYLGAFCYRFNSRFALKGLLVALLGHAANGAPTSERKIRETPVAEVHD